MLQISIFWVVIIIFAIHTILTHLFNWLFRKSNENTLGIIIGFQIVEIVLFILWLDVTL